MLNSITLKFSQQPQPVILQTEGITIFVGPNNSGKSLILREIDTATRQAQQVTNKILSDFEPTNFEESDLQELIELHCSKNPSAHSPEQFIVGKFQQTGDLEQAQVHSNSLKQWHQGGHKYHLTSQFLRFFLTHLDGQSRLAMCQDKAIGNLQEKPLNHLALLFQNDKLRSEVQSQIHASLGSYFVLDPTNGGSLQIRFSSQPMPVGLERSLENSAVEFFKNTVPIAQASDGIKAFVGIYLAAKCGECSTILVDEPEAFLHPPLARKLGSILARTVADKSKSLLVATHSSDFLLGCLQASDNVRVVRLEYSNGQSNCHIVDAKKLKQFYSNPLVRSANVLAGLFYDGVVVTESDNDRAFYSEIYFRLAENDKHLPSILFVNTQGKDTIHQIISVLRSFGVPTVAIPDLDILCLGGKNFSNWLNSACVPVQTQFGLGQSRSLINESAKQLEIDLKISGIDGFENKDKEAASELLDTLERYGIFATRKGELENWLKHLDVKGKKTEWAVGMLEALGSDPVSDQYVRPAADDVWEHLQRVVAWVRNPARQGMT